MLRLGLIGCGRIAEQVYLPLCARSRSAHIVALADADPARLAASHRSAPDAALCADAERLITHAAVDAVIIAAPSHLHAPLATAAFARGLHAFVEKPLAATLEDAARVVQAWRASGAVGMVGFNGRFNPLYRRLHAALRSGAAGAPVCVRTVFTTAPHEVPPWKRQRATGGGVLLDLASHHVDLVRFLFARDVTQVHATVQSRRTEHDTALLELTLDDGLLVQSFFSLAAAERDHVEVYGERARLSVGRFTSLDVAVHGNPAGGRALARALWHRAAAVRRFPAAMRARRAPLGDPGYAHALAHFIDAVRGASADGAAANPVDGMACAAVLDAAERSAATGEPVAVPTLPVAGPLPTPPSGGHSTSALSAP